MHTYTHLDSHHTKSVNNRNKIVHDNFAPSSTMYFLLVAFAAAALPQIIANTIPSDVVNDDLINPVYSTDSKIPDNTDELVADDKSIWKFLFPDKIQSPEEKKFADPNACKEYEYGRPQKQFICEGPEVEAEADVLYFTKVFNCVDGKLVFRFFPRGL